MNHRTWYLVLVLSLVLFSVLSYSAQILIFRKPEDTFFYLMQDIAFLPIQVLIVTFIINELLTRREKLSMIKKLNMVIGVFFSELGNGLIHKLFEFDNKLDELRTHLIITDKWSRQDFDNATKLVKSFAYGVDSKKGHLEGLKLFLSEKRPFLLTLMENPNLLEHEAFTDLLLAVSHLTEELLARTDIKALPKHDLDHLSVDIKRAYAAIITEWLAYMRHMKEDYPFLYSFAVRTNPFNPEASPEIKYTG
ncbi:MAG: hypothetical protein HQL10_08590 [Nitrospirae bacterium]|nr:hypothetical protein [Nitrospirota bacterium]